MTCNLGRGFTCPHPKTKQVTMFCLKNRAKLNVKPPIAIFFVQRSPGFNSSHIPAGENITPPAPKPSSNCCWNCCKFSWQAASFLQREGTLQRWLSSGTKVFPVFRGFSGGGFIWIDSQSSLPNIKANPWLPENFGKLKPFTCNFQPPTSWKNP